MKNATEKERTKITRWSRILSTLLAIVFMFPPMGAHAKTYTVSELTIQTKHSYDSVTPIGEGYYKVTKKTAVGTEQWGIIDAAGNVTAPLTDTAYDYMDEVSEGLILVGQDVDNSNKTGTKYQSKGIDKYGYIDVTGKEVIPLSFEYAKSFSNGRACVAIYYDYEYTEGIFKGQITRKPLYGFIDKTGEMIIPAIYDSTTSFVGKMSFYAQTTDLRENHNCGFSDGLACVGKDGKWGAIDVNGNIVVPFVYDKMFPFSEGLAEVLKDGKWGYVDTAGKLVIPCIYDATDGFLNGMAVVSKKVYDKNGNYDFLDGAINKEGILTVPMTFSSLWDFSEGMAVFTEKVGDTYKAGYVDTNGNIVVPAIYDLASNFVEGLARVGITTEDARHRSDCKWGYIDKTGKMVIPMEYDDAEDFSEGIAVIGCATGQWIEAYGTAYKVKQYGFINKNGVEIVPATSYSVSSSENGVAIVTPQKGGKSILIKNPCYEEFLEDRVPTTFPLDPARAVPTSSKILVDGKSVSFEAYNIGGSNYFKLRDLAKVLTGTAKQFEVSWDGDAKAIRLTSGKPYTIVGGELSQGDGTEKFAQPTVSPIYLNGEKISLIAYNVNGNNYFKLRDIGQAFDFDVSWNNSSKVITVNTRSPYTED